MFLIKFIKDNIEDDFLKKVSIIVTVYKTERYLQIFVNNLVNKTSKNIELILANDLTLDNFKQNLEM